MSAARDVSTKTPIEAVNVTDVCAGLLPNAATGVSLFYLPHTTAALVISEDDDELRDDLARVAQELLAPLRPFRHRRKNNPNAEAHVLSSLAGVSIMVPFTGGRLELGTYQTIMLLEFDGPKTRQIRCRILTAQ
jgi:secondary thiamine-phosphate synthase enzyme